MLKCILMNSIFFRKQETFDPLGVTIHMTAENSPYLQKYIQPSSNDEHYSDLLQLIGINKNNDDWNHTHHSKNYHYWIGRGAEDNKYLTVQTFPEYSKGIGCEMGKKDSGDNYFLQLMVCRDKNSFEDIYKELVCALGDICKKFDWNPIGTSPTGIPIINSHNECAQAGYATQTPDIDEWLSSNGRTMEQLRNDVKALIL